MATVSKSYRLVNPGRRKRKNAGKKRWSLAERAAFARRMKRARAAKKNPTKRKRKNYGTREGRSWSSYSPKKRRKNPKRRKRNVSSIITIWPKSNPGRKRRYKRRKRNSSKRVVIVNKGVKMAKRRRRNRAVSRRRNRSYRRRRNVSVRRYRRHRRSNPGVKRYSRRRRRSNPGRRRHYGRRRNPGMLSGTAGRIAGVLGGIAVTKFLLGFVPSSINTGIMGSLASAVVAVAQGKLIGKVAKNAALGDDFMVGGLAYTVATLLNQFFPSVGSYTGISGMGLIGGSSFYVPQVNMAGNMGQFVVPSAVTGAIPMAPASAGMGRMRRTGRLM